MRATIILFYVGNHLENSWDLVVIGYKYWFSEVVVLGSPPRAMTSQAMESWLGFQYQHDLPLLK